MLFNIPLSLSALTPILIPVAEQQHFSIYDEPLIMLPLHISRVWEKIMYHVSRKFHKSKSF
jgi:hypothetical protein